MIVAAALLVYSVTYVEVMPTSRADGLAALTSYREATRQESGNLRCEVASRLGQPHQFVILEVWQDQGAFEAHGKSANATQTRSVNGRSALYPATRRMLLMACSRKVGLVDE